MKEMILRPMKDEARYTQLPSNGMSAEEIISELRRYFFFIVPLHYFYGTSNHDL